MLRNLSSKAPETQNLGSAKTTWFPQQIGTSQDRSITTQLTDMKVQEDDSISTEAGQVAPMTMGTWWFPVAGGMVIRPALTMNRSHPLAPSARSCTPQEPRTVDGALLRPPKHRLLRFTLKLVLKVSRVYSNTQIKPELTF